MTQPGGAPSSRSAPAAMHTACIPGSDPGMQAVCKRPARRPALRLVSARPLRVVDVATWYGERSGGIRTYLDAKSAFARRTGAFEHRLVVPGIVRKVTDHTCSLPSIRVATSNGYRWPIGTRPLVDLLRELDPDVVLLHDPFWAPRAVAVAAVRRW